MEFYISASTDIGTYRSVNQDSLFVRKLDTPAGEMVFAVLCDGMGGLQHGEVASASLISGFSEWMYKALPELSKDPLEDWVIRRQWSDIITEQNNIIRDYGYKNHCFLGTTVTAFLLTEYRYFLLNIGDSRAYAIGDNVVQLTEDHTLAANEVRLGNLSPKQAESAPGRNVLTKCVGIEETVQPDMFFGTPSENIVYMLCSDGFRHLVTPEEMQKYLRPVGEAEISEMKCREEYLIELDKKRGETDNISVITIYTTA